MLSSLIRRFVDAKIKGVDTDSLWGKGKLFRESIYADDVAQAGYLLMRSDLQALKLPVNIGSGKGISIKKLAEKIVAIVGYKGGIHWDTSKPDGTPKKQLDVGRLASLGWRARIPLAQGLASTVALFRQQLATGELRL